MPLKKIGENKPICVSPEHNPPMHMYLEAGTYEWTCPACEEKQVFTVMGVTYSAGNTSAHLSQQSLDKEYLGIDDWGEVR